ncbi:MAG: hypothetical protein LBT83_03120 [Tannerella sp.]|nr:hypothetical protein [Tannerella sp.]
MKQIAKNKVVIAWLLLTVLVMPCVVKPLHVYCHHDGDVECAHAIGDCDDCPLCHFTLSTFVETETYTCRFVPLFFVFEAAACLEKITLAAVSFSHLRGPPGIEI